MRTHVTGFLPAAAVIVFAAMWLTSCLASQEDLLAGKACTAGACADGYICAPKSNICVPVGTPVGAQGGESTQTTGGNGGSGGDGGVGGAPGGAGGSGGDCVTPADCPGTGVPCIGPICLGGVCGTANVAPNSPLIPSDQTPGDCMTAVCDGLGGVMTVNDDADLPDDTNACTADLCTAGVASNEPVGIGSSCSQGGTV